MIVGCEAPTTDDPVLAEWYRYCHVTTHLHGCERSVLSETTCTMLGDSAYADMPVECHEPARVYWQCLADLPWQCPPDDQDPRTDDPPVADQHPCDQAMNAYAACLPPP